MTTAVSALVVQMFLIRRYFHLVRDFEGPWKPICLAILSLAALGSAYGSAVVIITHSTYAERGRMTVPVTLWLGVSAVTDWSIALLLIHKLRQMRSDFKSSVGIVQRISYITIQTGAATSTVALTALFLYLASMTTNISTFFGFCLGTTYSLTMLHNLNRRHALGARKSATDSESRAGDAETGPLGIGFSALTPSSLLNSDASDPTTTSRSHHQTVSSPCSALTASGPTETSIRTFAKLAGEDVVVSQLLGVNRPIFARSSSSASVDSSIISR